MDIILSSKTVEYDSYSHLPKVKIEGYSFQEYDRIGLDGIRKAVMRVLESELQDSSALNVYSDSVTRDSTPYKVNTIGISDVTYVRSDAIFVRLEGCTTHYQVEAEIRMCLKEMNLPYFEPIIIEPVYKDPVAKRLSTLGIWG